MTNAQADDSSPIHALVERKCVICGGSDHVLAYDQPTENIIGIGNIGYHHLINVCNDCGFVFASPLLKESVILKYYEQMSNYEHPESTGIRPPGDIQQINRQIDLISARFPAGFKGRALDIGCSIAYGLSLLQDEGWDVLGLDPSDKCIEISRRKLSVKVQKGFFDTEFLPEGDKFDLVILSHVVEHLVHPEQVIRGLANMLTDQGLIYIEVPNLMKPNGLKCYFGFEHVNFFTPTSLKNLVQQCGFEVDSLTTFDNSKEIHPYYPVIAVTIRKSERQLVLENDRAAALRVITQYQDVATALAQKLNARIAQVLKATPEGRIALWGAGIHTSQLLSETVLKNAKIHCIYDSDPKKEGCTLMGIEIRRFPNSVQEAKREIDAILISSESSEEAIYNQIKQVENQGLKLYLLYRDL